MKTQSILVHLNQLAGEVQSAIRSEKDEREILGLLDCEEYLRRAARALGALTGEDNDTNHEIDLAKQHSSPSPALARAKYSQGAGDNLTK